MNGGEGMRIAASLSAALLLALAPLPAAANAAPPLSPAIEDVLRNIQDDLGASRLTQARAKIEQLLARPLPAPLAGRLRRVRASLLFLEGRRDEAMAAFAAAEAVAPADPSVALFELDFAYRQHDPILAMAAVDHLVDRYPEAARALEPTRITPLIGWMRQNDRRREADDLTIRLARIGFGGDDLATRDNFAIEAAGAALAAGRMDEAQGLAAPVNSRRELTMALTERRFSGLWPAIEARVGPHMAIAEAAAIRDAEAIAARRPQDVAARHGLLQAYYQAGRYADADRIGAAFAATQAEMRTLGEPGGWLVNDHALVLHAMGRRADADARFAALRAVDIEQNGWLISMVINRLELLVRDRQWDQALRLQDEAASLAEHHGSPYARQLVRRLRLCTLHGLGRTAEADAILGELRAHEADSPGATIDGLICTGRLDEAEPVLLRWLERPDQSGAVVDALQPEAAARTTDPSVWTAGWQQLAARPGVRQALERVGRILPEAFWPQAGH